MEKFQARLTRWKAKALSTGGRRVLTKAVLGNLANYVMSIFKAPITVIKKLEKLRRDFFWGADIGEKKIAWIKWGSTVRSFDNGGLALGSIEAANIAMLTKWVWKFKSETGSMWGKVVKAIHGSDGGLENDEVGAGGNGPWANILKTMKWWKVKGIRCDDLMCKQVGDGKETSFWNENWTGEGRLRKSYPRLYELDRNRFVTVADRIENNVLNWSWRRDVRGGRETE